MLHLNEMHCRACVDFWRVNVSRHRSVMSKMLVENSFPNEALNHLNMIELQFRNEFGESGHIFEL